jgi:hypothetical protein
MHFFDKTMTILSFMVFALLLNLIIAFLAYLLNDRDEYNKKIKLYAISSIVALVCHIMLLFFLGTILKKAIKDEFIEFINKKQTELSITLNGKSVNNKDQIIRDLSVFGWYNSDHNGPKEEEIIINLTSKGINNKIILFQDNKFENQFWVYILEYRYSRLNGIGRIQSDYILELIN